MLYRFFDIKLYIAFILSFSITGMIFPYGIPIYSVAVGIIFLYTIYIKRSNIFIFNRSLLALYLLELIYIVSMLQSDRIYINNIKDIINIITFHMIFIVLINNLKNKLDFEIFSTYFKNIIFVLVSIVGVISFYKYILLSYGYDIKSFYIYEDISKMGTSLVIDYNMFALGFFVAIIFSYDILRNSINIFYKVLIVSTTTLLIFIVLFSGSRRAVLILAILFLVLIVFKYLKKKISIKKNIFFIGISIVTFASLFYLSNIYNNENNYKVQDNSNQLKIIINRTKSISNYSSVDDRIIRWEYANDMFKNYNIKENIVGSGFDYLYLYGEKFAYGNVEDYPHNILLSHLLFSGLLGIIILCLIYYQIISLYIKYNILRSYFILFLITTSYLLISGNSFFSFKINLLLIIIPFIYQILEQHDDTKNKLNYNIDISIVYLTHTDINSDSRILKEMNSISKYNTNYKVNGIGVVFESEKHKTNQESLINIYSITLKLRKLIFLPTILRHVITLFELTFKMIYIALKLKPKVIHCNDTLVLPLGVMIKFLTGARLIYDAHELESDRNGLTKTLGKMTLFIEKILWKYIDALIVVSPSIDSWYKEHIGEKYSAVILNSPVIEENLLDKDEDYLRNRFNILHDSKIFLYIGILGKGRGIDLIIEAFKKPDVKSSLVFLGYGELSHELKELEKEYPNIYVHDAVPHEKVVSIAKSADVGLCLIQNVSLSDYYCLPNKLFEYCFSEIPVLASDFPDISKVVKEYNLGECTQLDSLSIHSAIQKFEAMEKVPKIYEKNLYNLSWKAQEEKLVRLYEKVLKGNK